ncbi:enoyl-CoA hydratase/isomerase family protein [Paenarthrobacter nitroguajacolicus]|uniref:enoyl-CoA hydratase/isomerase family protein n=1 Tax=Paenarthrobacter nitroguajacolicus TaxID=211146 RepID=UPI0040547656
MNSFEQHLREQVAAAGYRPEALRALEVGNPHRGNSLDAAAVERLHHGIDSAVQEGARFLVLTGSGKLFSSGFDLATIETETDSSLLYRFVRIALLLDKLQRAPLTSVALINGPAVGAGADLAMACDIRWASECATIRFPGSTFGVVLGVERLRALIPAETVRDLVTSRRTVNSGEAEALNLFTDILPPEGRASWWHSKLLNLIKTTPQHAPATHQLLRPPMDLDRAMCDLVTSIAGEPGFQQRISAFARNHFHLPRQ